MNSESELLASTRTSFYLKSFGMIDKWFSKMTTWLNCLGALKNSTDQIKSEYLGLRPTHRYVFRDFSK